MYNKYINLIIGKDDAIKALKQSVMLDNPSDWQLLVELTSITDD